MEVNLIFDHASIPEALVDNPKSEIHDNSFRKEKAQAVPKELPICS